MNYLRVPTKKVPRNKIATMHEKKVDRETVIHTQPFSAKIVVGDDNNKRLVVRNKVYYQHQINQFPENENVTLLVSNRKPKRTTQQNNYYWGVYLPLIASETGEDNISHLHEYFKGKFLTKSIVKVMGNDVRIKKSTTGLNTKEFSDYVRAIETETGVQAPPTEDYGLESL